MNLLNKLNQVVSAGRRTVRQLQFMRLYWQLINDMKDTSLVFKLSDIMQAEMRELGPAELAKYLDAAPAYREMLKERYLAPTYRLEDLAGYAPGTLGHAFYHHMTSHNLKLDFYPSFKVVDDLSYMDLRISQTHDIWHVVTGYDIDVVGEIALQAFYLAQADDDDTFATLLISTGTAYAALHAPEIMGQLIRGISEGYTRGKAAKSFYPVKWEERWNCSLATIRAELNVQVHELAPGPTLVSTTVAV